MKVTINRWDAASGKYIEESAIDAKIITTFSKYPGQDVFLLPSNARIQTISQEKDSVSIFYEKRERMGRAEILEHDFARRTG